MITEKLLTRIDLVAVHFPRNCELRRKEPRGFLVFPRLCLPTDDVQMLGCGRLKLFEVSRGGDSVFTFLLMGCKYISSGLPN